MKKILILLTMLTTLNADIYIDYINRLAIMQEESLNEYKAKVIKASAGLASLSSFDFNPNKEGLSIGAGTGTIQSEEETETAYAVGVQYGLGYGAINVKTAYENSNEYILTTGIVISF